MSGEKVLVTGASGFMAAHAIDQLIELGYSIIGTVRSDSKGEFYVKKYGSKFQYEIVKDISVLNAFDHVFQAHPDIKYVQHTASPVQFDGEDPENALIKPAINGTLSALLGAHKYGSNVKKIVITSSFAAMIQTPPLFNDHSKIYSSADWNNVTLEEGKQNMVVGYEASKALAEKAAWNFIETEKPKFTITTIQIPMIFGPPINDIGIKNLNSSTATFYNLIKSEKSLSNELPELLPFYIDVRDCAKAHVRAMTTTGLDNKRCFTMGGLGPAQRFVDILRKVKPEYDSVLPLGIPGSFSENDYAQYDVSDSQKYLNISFIPIEKTVLDTVNRIEALEAEATRN